MSGLQKKPMDSALYSKVLEHFAGRKIIVVGDMVVDRYIYGNTNRVSREAPVLILQYDQEQVLPGGAGNSINNIHALTATPLPIGVVGQDESGKKLVSYFKDKGIDTRGIIVDKNIRTITKTRIMGGGFNTTRQQLIRIDEEHDGALNEQINHKLMHVFNEYASKADGILISDYGYGVLNKFTRQIILKKAHEYRMASLVDSRYNLLDYKGIMFATPNEVEAIQNLDVSSNGKEEILSKAGSRLVRKLGLKGLIITRGRLGMMVFEKNKKPAEITVIGGDEVADVTGAGDTVASTVLLAISSGASILEAAKLANFAASVVVMKRGTATASPREIMEVINKNYSSP